MQIDLLFTELVTKKREASCQYCITHWDPEPLPWPTIRETEKVEEGETNFAESSGGYQEHRAHPSLCFLVLVPRLLLL